MNEYILRCLINAMMSNDTPDGTDLHTNSRTQVRKGQKSS